MVYLMICEGFEEIEAITTVDILRRAGLDVSVVGVGARTVKGAHGITVIADVLDSEVICENMEAVVLPGGPGAARLEQASSVQRMIDTAIAVNAYLAAICAAPSILGRRDLLKGKRAVCFPGYEKTLAGATVCDDAVVIDGRVITARGAGVAVDFALAIVAALAGDKKAQALRGALQCRS